MTGKPTAVLTWAYHDGAFCFFIDGQLVKRCTKHELRGLLQGIGQAVEDTPRRVD